MDNKEPELRQITLPTHFYPSLYGNTCLWQLMYVFDMFTLTDVDCPTRQAIKDEVDLSRDYPN